MSFPLHRRPKAGPPTPFPGQLLATCVGIVAVTAHDSGAHAAQSGSRIAAIDGLGRPRFFVRRRDRWVPDPKLDLPVSPVQAAAAPGERLSAALPASAPDGGSSRARGGPPVPVSSSERGPSKPDQKTSASPQTRTGPTARHRYERESTITLDTKETTAVAKLRTLLIDLRSPDVEATAIAYGADPEVIRDHTDARAWLLGYLRGRVEHVLREVA